jgi:hypothetical protein
MREVTNDELYARGARAFQMMIEPRDVPLRTDRERDVFNRGYNDAKNKWWEKNRKAVRYDKD